MAEVAEAFEREHGCTEAEWLVWLPEAVHGHAVVLDAPGRACIAIRTGTLQIDWHELPPRRIALLHLPRMQMRYEFRGVGPVERQRFMKRFDLYLQRGGG